MKCEYCGCERTNQNTTNWCRHIESCKKKKDPTITAKKEIWIPNIEPNDDSMYVDLFKIPTAEITTTAKNINLTNNSTSSGKLVCTYIHTFQRSKDFNK